MSDLSQKLANLSLEKRKLLLERLKRKNGKGSKGEIVPIAREAGSMAGFPLSFTQQRLWFLERLDPNTAVYNIPIAIRLEGPMRPEALRCALNDIVARHEMLRTRFAAVDGEPRQFVVAEMLCDLREIDLTTLSGDERVAEMHRRINQEARQPFDLSRAPLLRTTLIKLAETEQIFMITMHHIVGDQWSLEIFFNELAVLYKAHLEDKSSPLARLPIQYADYAVWQRQRLSGDYLEQTLSYWRKKLAGAPALLELPTDRPRPAMQTFPGAAESVYLPHRLLDDLKRLSRQHKVTLFVTLLAAFKVLLQRYSGQTDIVVGSPIANRTRAEIEDLIGFFSNTLVLRTDLSGDPRFSELLSRVSDTVLDASAYQDVPFEKLVEELKPERDLSTSPFFQVIFIHQNVPERDNDLAGMKLSNVNAPSGTAKFDLTFYTFDYGAGPSGVLEYNTDLFDSGTIRRMLGHYHNLLESVVLNPDQRLSELTMLTVAEREQIFLEWNATRSDYERDRCMHELFEAQAARTPEAVAAIFDKEQITYCELNTRANQLAQYLHRQGAGPDVLVGLCVERSLEMLVGLLGILKAGGAYVPLDPVYPRERIEYVLADAGASLLLTQEAVARELLGVTENSIEETRSSNSRSAIRNPKSRIIRLDSDWPEIANESSWNPVSHMHPANLAYAIYTSGSTGRPKGVAISHGSLLNFLQSMGEKPALTSDDTLLAVTTLSFDIACLELYLPLLHGARVVIASREQSSDGRSLQTLIETQQVSMLQATPATWRLLIDSGWQSGHGLKVLCGGEAMPRDLATQLLDSGVELWNMYGPTETTIWSSVHHIENRDGLLSIGRPIANTQIYMLDRYFNAVPAGVHGELCIGGYGLARGYLNRPDLTAERFIPDGLGAETGGRVYRTGDLARHLGDGTLDCLGRLDHQVKVRGFRIELGEIESVLLDHERIDQAVVVVREDGSGNKLLVGYLVCRSGEQLGVSALREHLSQKLPDYMVPPVFVYLAELPLTPNGKIDRKALPEPDRLHVPTKEGYAAPENPIEEIMTEIWAEVLGKKRVGIDENFFALGGHSLLAVRLFLEVEKNFQRSLPLASIFKAPTVRQLSAMISDAEMLPSYGSLVPLQEEGDKPPLFCVSGLAGHTFNYRQLSRHLGSDQPVYGLQYPGLDGREHPLTNVESIARVFVDKIREVQPRGPYYLSGLCFGGLVIYEMAQQLNRLGEKVAFLCMIDTFTHDAIQNPEWRTLVRLYVNHVKSLDFKGKIEFSQERASYFARWLRSKFRSDDGIETLKRGATLQEWIEHVRQANLIAQRHYRPKPYDGKVTLFTPTKRNENWSHLRIDPQHGWGKLAGGGVEKYPISGYHNKMFREPKVNRLARKMSDCLERVRHDEVRVSDQPSYEEALELDFNSH